MIHPATLDDDEQFFYRQIEDIFYQSQGEPSPKFSFFLNPRQQKIALTATSQEGSLFGGYKNATRQVLGFDGYNEALQNENFPIRGVAIIHKTGDKLSHRHVLGSIMGLHIDRSTIGDILPSVNSTVVVCLDTVAPILLQELDRIGSIGVKTQSCSLEGLVSVQEYEQVSGTLSSLRLDGLVSLLARAPRSKGAALIVTGLVQQNYTLEEKPATPFKVDDIITIRGVGKFVIDQINSPTKKGRLPIRGRKYL